MDPIPGWTQKFWNAWDIRLLILTSLILQLILVALGSRRQYIRGIWIEIIVWSSYLMADWVAAIAVGKLSNSATEPDSTNGNTDDNEANKALTALWAPLLLLHLGGPDTITAYSIEDTQLWLRHLFGLLAQAVLTIYVILCSWNNSALSFFTLPMFIAGTIKYGERTWVLWSANNDDQEGLETIEGYASALDLIRDIPGVKLVVVAYFWLQALTPYLANYGGNFNESERVAHISAEFDTKAEIFELIEYVLGFMYDVLYTKTAMIHTRLGFILRAITFTCLVTVLVGFSTRPKHEYLHINVVITYVLLGVAVALEFYAAAMTIYSDWGILQMIKYCRKPYVSTLVRTLAPWTKSWKRWSNSVTQFNLISFVRYEGKPKILFVLLKVIRMDNNFKKFLCQSNVYQESKESANEKPKMIYRVLKLFKKSRVSNVKDLQKLKEVILEGVETINERLWEFENFTHRGELALERNQCSKDLQWSVKKDFDQSIIAWHIATDICCNFDGNDSKLDAYTKSRKETAKILSNYMMHLLVNHPYMLRIKGGNVMIEHTCSHLKETFRGEKSMDTSKPEFWKTLGEKGYDDDEKSAIQGWPAPRSPLVLARIVAKLLLSANHEKRKWKILSSVWVEMLCHAAVQCQVNYHAKQLTGGGELLTHVWLLLTIYGFTEKVNEAGPTLRKIFTEKSIAATRGKGGF